MVKDGNEFKIYIDVIVKYDTNGRIIPMEIIWEDGRHYLIDKVLDQCRKASLKAGGVGWRYTVMIMGQERYLWFDDCEKLWYVEAK